MNDGGRLHRCVVSEHDREKDTDYIASELSRF